MKLSLNDKEHYLLVHIQYFGTVDYINTLFQNSNIIIEQYESWQKMSFRNRTVIAGSNGVINLSVPLEKGRGQKELTKDVRISYRSNWQAEHLRTIRSCYGRAPFFEFYFHEIEGVLSSRQTFLLDLNLDILDWLVSVFKAAVSIERSGGYAREPMDAVDLRNRFGPKDEPVGKLPVYTQVFEDRIGFRPNLSILDLLLCSGPSQILR